MTKKLSLADKYRTKCYIFGHNLVGFRSFDAITRAQMSDSRWRGFVVASGMGYMSPRQLFLALHTLKATQDSESQVIIDHDQDIAWMVFGLLMPSRECTKKCHQ